MKDLLGFLNTDHNRAELCEAHRKLSVIFGYLHRYQGVLTIAMMLTVCALPSLAQLPSQNNNMFDANVDQTATSWGDSAVNFFFYLMPILALYCLAMLIVNIIRKQGWANYGIGLAAALGGWGLIGALAYSLATGKTIKPTSIGR